MKRTGPIAAGTLLFATITTGCSQEQTGSTTTDAEPTQEQAMAEPTQNTPESAPEQASQSVLAGITMDRLAGEPESLESYQGQVVLVVNTASKCGYTRQYDGLQNIYSTYADQGFVVLGFPANDFGAQEPGSNEEIGEFCRVDYGVEFPMFAKTSVLGDNCNPLHARLRDLPDPLGGEPRWNFTKFLIDREGNVVARFESKVEPESEEVTSQIEQLLGA